MRYWFDCEFLESGYGQPLWLLSIGIVAGDGREYYAINADCPTHLANDWVKANVLPYIDQCGPDARLNHLAIREEIRAFCNPAVYGKPEFWAYYADYDWVMLCQVFGRMVDLPKDWPMYCRDIKQWCDQLGNPPLPEQGEGEHHALADARWNQQAWRFLVNLGG